LSAEETLEAVLAAASPVTDVIGDRIFKDVIPHGQPLPAIAYFRTDTEYVQTIHAAAPAGSTPSLSVACVADTRDAADTLAEVVIAALGAGGFNVVGRGGSFDLETNMVASVVNVAFNE
jgi:Protein of unknown function (DUF3168)